MECFQNASDSIIQLDWCQFTGGIGVVLKWLLNVLDEAIPYLLVTLMTAYFAKRAYYQKKEYEAIRDRYLEHGFDEVSASLDRVLVITRSNWARLLFLTKGYEELTDLYEMRKFDGGLIGFDTGDLASISNQRVHFLVNSDVIWILQQKIVAFAKSSDDFIRAEAPFVLEKYKDRTAPDKKELVKFILNKLNGIDRVTQTYQNIVASVVQLGQIFERQNHNYKSIEQFSKIAEVQNALYDIKQGLKSIENIQEELKDADANV